MVVCKYFQQGNCRFGQYCRFEHVNFDVAQGVENKLPYGEGKSIILGVAEEVLAAERGGQWLLSCFGPFKEQASIPGMEDVSPEEFRWEIYQAQQNGNVEQTKMQFQRLCQEMSKKREALKNPTHETIEMLDKLHKSQRGSTFPLKSSSNSTFGPPNSTSRSNGGSMFPPKMFPAATSTSSFGETFNATSSSQGSVFTRPTTTTGSTVTPSPFFGGSSLFSNSNGTVNNLFGAFTNNHPTSKSIFGGDGGAMSLTSSTTTFGQPNNNNNNNSNNSNDTFSTGSAGIFSGASTVTISPSIFCNQGIANSAGRAFQQATKSTNEFSTSSVVPTQAFPTNEAVPTVPSQIATPMLNSISSRSASVKKDDRTLPMDSNNYTALGNYPNMTESVTGSNPSGNMFNVTKLEQQQTMAFNAQRNHPPTHLSTFGHASFSLTNNDEMVDQILYSNEDDLTNDEKMLYLSPNFELGKIPTKPPTIQMR